LPVTVLMLALAVVLVDGARACNGSLFTVVVEGRCETGLDRPVERAGAKS
jgi:hypothetical protein